MGIASLLRFTNDDLPFIWRKDSADYRLRLMGEESFAHTQAACRALAADFARSWQAGRS